MRRGERLKDREGVKRPTDRKMKRENEGIYFRRERITSIILFFQLCYWCYL